MKKRLLLIAAVMVLSACDAQKKPEAFTPEMASFSNEFEFDPLRGPVKDFSQTLFDEHDEVVKRVSASLSREGCFDLLDLEDRENNTGATLMLDANFYLDARTREKRLRLQGKCQLAELPSAGITWETDDNGFVVAARGKETTATYRYDSEGYPTGKTTVAKNERFTVGRRRIRVKSWITRRPAPLTIVNWGKCVKPVTTIATITRLIASCRWSMKAFSRR